MRTCGRRRCGWSATWSPWAADRLLFVIGRAQAAKGSTVNLCAPCTPDVTLGQSPRTDTEAPADTSSAGWTRETHASTPSEVHEEDGVPRRRPRRGRAAHRRRAA